MLIDANASLSWLSISGERLSVDCIVRKFRPVARVGTPSSGGPEGEERSLLQIASAAHRASAGRHAGWANFELTLINDFEPFADGTKCLLRVPVVGETRLFDDVRNPSIKCQAPGRRYSGRSGDGIANNTAEFNPRSFGFGPRFCGWLQQFDTLIVEALSGDRIAGGREPLRLNS